jgi:hypothetical protein
VECRALLKQQLRLLWIFHKIKKTQLIRLLPLKLVRGLSPKLDLEQFHLIYFNF